MSDLFPDIQLKQPTSQEIEPVISPELPPIPDDSEFNQGLPSIPSDDMFKTAQEKIDNIIDLSDNPDELKAKTDNIQILSDMFQKTPAEISPMYSTIKQYWTGDAETSDTDFFQRVGNAYKIGVIQTLIGRLRIKQIYGSEDPEIEKTIQELYGLMPSPDDKERALPEQIITATANQLPIIAKILEKGLEVGGGSALGVWLIGKVFGPEAEPFVTAAAISAFSFGTTVGTTHAAFEMEAGLAYDELLNLTDENGNKIDPELAKAGAVGVGLINAGIELLQIKSIPGLSRLFSEAATEGAMEILRKKTLKDIVLKYAKNYAGYITKEVLQECAQESTNIIAGEIVKKLYSSWHDQEITKDDAAAIIDKFIVLQDAKNNPDSKVEWVKNLSEIEIFTKLTEFTETNRQLTSGIMIGYIQEMADSGISLTKENMLQYLNEKGFFEEWKAPEIPPATMSNIIDRIKETAIQSFLGFTGMGVLGGAKTVITDISGSISDSTKTETQKPEFTPKEIIEEPEQTPFVKTEEGETTIQIDEVNKRLAEYDTAIQGLESLKLDDPLLQQEYDNVLKDLRATREDLSQARDLTEFKTIDEYIGETESNIQEYLDAKGIVDSMIPETKEQLQTILGDLSVSGKDWYKGLSRNWISAALIIQKGGIISDAQYESLMKEIKNNPDRFQRLVISLDMNQEQIQAYETISKKQVEYEQSKQQEKINQFNELAEKLENANNIIKKLAIAKEFKDPNERLRIITGKYKLGDIIGEVEVKEGIKAVPKTVQKAVTEGKQTGIKQERARKKELLQKANEKKKLKAYIRKLAKRISRPVAANVDFYYREAIETLQEGIDPNFRAKKTLLRRERLKKYLEKYPEAKANIPKKILEMANKPSLGEITIGELEQLATETDRLRKQGRLKFNLEKDQENRNINNKIDRIVNNILGGKELITEKAPVVKATTKKGRIISTSRGIRASTLTPSRIFDKFDRGQDFKGETHEVFYNEVSRIEDSKLRYIDERIEPGEKYRKGLKISINDLGKSKMIDGFKYTLDERLDIYAGFKNDTKKLAIMFGNKIKETTAQKIINSLSADEKALADYIIQDYENRYNDLRQAHIDFTNQDLGHEKNYTPIKRTEVNYETLDQEIADSLLQRLNLKRAQAEKGFTMSRQNIPESFQKPTRLGLYQTWFEMVHKQEHYIAYAKKIRELHRINNNERFREAVKQIFGEEYLKAVEYYVDRVANPNIYKSYRPWENFIRVLRKNTAVGYLAYNIVTIAKQLPSLMFYMPEAGPARVLASVAKFIVNPVKAIRDVNEKAPQIKHRSIEREIDDLRYNNRSVFERAINKVGMVGMRGIMLMDRVAVTIGWQAVYDKYMGKNYSEEQAIQEATNYTLRTQPASNVKDMAGIYFTNEVLNFFLMFSNQLNKIYNITTYDLPTAIKSGKIYKGLLTMASLAAGALSIWTLSNHRLPEKPDDYKAALSEQFLNALPLIGKYIVAAQKGYDQDVPIANMIGILLSDAKDKTKAKALIEGLTTTFGVPYIGPKRIIEAIQEEKPELLLGKPKREGVFIK